MSDKIVLIGFSILSLFTMGIGFYKALKSKPQSNKQDVQQIQKHEEQINKQSDKLNSLQALLSDKAQNVELKYLKYASQILTVDCLKEILEFTASIIDSEQLQAIYYINREARRSCFTAVKANLGSSLNEHLGTYFRFACTFQQQLQYLIQKSQKDFVVFLNLQYSVITDSIDFHICQPDSHFSQWVKEWSLRIKQALRQKLPLYQIPVTPAKILEIAQFQIRLLTSQAQSLKKSIKDLSLETEDQQQAIPTFLQVFLEDVIHEQFGIEIEQTNLASEDLTLELQQKLHVLTQLQASVLNSLLEEQEAVSQSDQIQVQREIEQ